MNRAKVLVVGSGRMGKIRASIIRANPRFDLCGIVDVNLNDASALADKYLTDPFESLSDAFDYLGMNTETETCINEVSSSSSRTNRNGKNRNTRFRHTKSFSTAGAPETAINFNDDEEEDPAINPIMNGVMGKSKPLDGIVISSPTLTHKDLIEEAAPHGLSIFSEKPVDETADQIRYLFEFCKTQESHLCCGFQRRFDDSYSAAQRTIADGQLGKPLMANIFFADHPCPPMEFLLTGGNIFSDLSAHDVDYIRWCLKDEVESVYATGTSSTEKLREAGVHDNATLVMKFIKGTVVTLSLSRSASYGYDQRCQIFGEKGLVTVGNEHANTSILSNQDGVHSSPLKHSFPQRFHQAFTSELDAFADTMLLGKKWPVSEEDCIAVQKISDAARASCELNEVVHLV